MKKIITILAAVILTANVFAQAPQMMTYQSVIRNAGGTLVTNTAVGIKISILQDSATGIAVYQEIFNPNPHTNANGLVSISVGGGIPVFGTFSAINWGNGPYYIETQTDPTGGTNYTITGTSQLLSVPYALYSATSSSGGFSNMQVFSSTGSSNFTVPNGVTKVMVEVWGAGGGGGGNNVSAFSGGGAGGYGKGIFSVTPSAFYTVTVGSGGPGGSSGAGTSGGASNFGILISASGGGGGSAIAGAGGTSTAPFNITGGAGEYAGSGIAGQTPNGGNAGQGGQGGNYNNNAANSPGGGGAGNTNTTGGNGGNGEVVVWW